MAEEYDYKMTSLNGVNFNILLLINLHLRNIFNMQHLLLKAIYFEVIIIIKHNYSIINAIKIFKNKNKNN